MDPTKLPTLDPKLKETYERVMGTQLNTPADPSTPPPPADQIPNDPSIDPIPTSGPSMDQLQTPALDNQLPSSPSDPRPQADLSAMQPSTDQSVAPPTSSEPPQADMSAPAADAQMPPIPQPIPGHAIEPPGGIAPAPDAQPQAPAQPQPFVTNQATVATGGFLAGAAAGPQKKAGLLPILYIVGGVIFFIAYIVFWIYFFQIPVPFLPF